MKNTIFITAFAMIIAVSCVNDNLPVMVKKKFSELYPEAKLVKWEKRKDENYIANYDLKGHHWSSVFSKYGNWIESSYKIPEAKFPSISILYIKQFYQNDTIRATEYLKNAEGAFFRVKVSVDTSELVIMFDSIGKLYKDENNLILKKFGEMFKVTKDVKWVKNSEGEYEVFFDSEGKTYRSSFSTDGNWLFTEYLIKPSEIPVEAFNYIKKNYKGYKTQGMIYHQTPDENLFQIIVIKDEKEVNLFFDLDGKFVRKTMVDEGKNKL